MKDINKKTFFISLAILFLGSVGVLAFVGPSQNPSSGISQFWQKNGSNMYYNTGSVGVGTTTPSQVLSVGGGDIYASGALRAETSLCFTDGCLTGWTDIPPGAVMSFNLSSCPAGWSEFTSARGRYIVGTPLGGNVATTTGTALSNQENRAVGQHTHTINDPGHTHTGMTEITSSGSYGAGGSTHYYANSGGSNDTGITVNNSGSVAGTNAPYVQLLTCQKN